MSLFGWKHKYVIQYWIRKMITRFSAHYIWWNGHPFGGNIILSMKSNQHLDIGFMFESCGWRCQKHNREKFLKIRANYYTLWILGFVRCLLSAFWLYITKVHFMIHKFRIIDYNQYSFINRTATLLKLVFLNLSVSTQLTEV